jgi:hypothetical protein
MPHIRMCLYMRVFSCIYIYIYIHISIQCFGTGLRSARAVGNVRSRLEVFALFRFVRSVLRGIPLEPTRAKCTLKLQDNHAPSPSAPARSSQMDLTLQGHSARGRDRTIPHNLLDNDGRHLMAPCAVTVQWHPLNNFSLHSVEGGVAFLVLNVWILPCTV